MAVRRVFRIFGLFVFLMLAFLLLLLRGFFSSFLLLLVPFFFFLHMRFFTNFSLLVSRNMFMVITHKKFILKNSVTNNKIH